MSWRWQRQTEAGNRVGVAEIISKAGDDDDRFSCVAGLQVVSRAGADRIARRLAIFVSVEPLVRVVNVD